MKSGMTVLFTSSQAGTLDGSCSDIHDNTWTFVEDKHPFVKHVHDKVFQCIYSVHSMDLRIVHSMDLRIAHSMDLRIVHSMDLRIVHSMDLRIVHSMDLRIVHSMDLCIVHSVNS